MKYTKLEKCLDLSYTSPEIKINNLDSREHDKIATDQLIA